MGVSSLPYIKSSVKERECSPVHDTTLCWLPFLGNTVSGEATTCEEMALSELALGLRRLRIRQKVTLERLPDAGEGYEIVSTKAGYQVRGGETGILYGTYALLMKLAAGMEPLSAWNEPCFSLRMLNHWDNMDGKVERGYAGASLFFENGCFAYDSSRLRLYGRYLASVGINTVSINNVNVHPPADGLITEALLPELKKVADLLRPFGIRLLVSIDYALPVTCGLPTADPLDPKVQAWWKNQVSLIYAAIPDLRGFLVKADSEFRPGPYLYHRNHAEGARVLAQALKPHGGIVVWRCFVYNCRQDWRDHETDRPRAAYDTYAPLEGQFDSNVVLQIKNGPYDFQVREPVSPLFYAMPATVKALELQLTQEYTGHQIDLYYMPPKWDEIFLDLHGAMPDHCSAVSNLGNDANWTGNDLAQANLFAYGQAAWQGKADSEGLARLWATLTFGSDALVVDTVTRMLLLSREIYESYTAPLGLCWMVTPHLHYGPSPEGYEYTPWGTYLRANRDAVGIDRTEKGTGYTRQYPAEQASRFESLEHCPEKLLLFFHRLRYDYPMRDGRQLIQRIYDDHFAGAEGAEKLAKEWERLEGKVPGAAYENIRERLARQIINAREWRDVVNTYFYRYSGIPDVQGRRITE